MALLTKRRASAAFIAVAILATLTPRAADAAPAGFVTSSGGMLAIDGTPWQPIGVNVWDFDVDAVQRGDLTGCTYQRADLDTYFDETFASVKRETGANVIRVFGFMASFTNGGTDFSSTDKLLHYARKHGLRVIAPLGNHYGICGSPEKPPEWYHCTALQPVACTPGYKQIERPWRISYRDYAIKVVQRYANEPGIALWQLMNEARPGEVLGTVDADALVDFSRDMATALRIEAGDPNHLITLGAHNGQPGTEVQHSGRYLDCFDDGGCLDVQSAHHYDPNTPLPGLPLASGIGAQIQATTGNAKTTYGNNVTPMLEGWVAPSFSTVPSADVKDWWIRLAVPAWGEATEVILDNVRVTTTTGTTTLSFESGLDGFTASGATLTQTSQRSTNGSSALHARIDPRSIGTAIDLRAPATDAPIVSVVADLWTSFRSPSNNTGKSLAAMLHSTNVRRAKPFIVDEVGYQAAVVEGVRPCGSHMSLDARASKVDAMISALTADEHRTSAVLMWDFKDPSIRRTRATDGASVTDRTIDCWSITPGDPSATMLKIHSGRLPVGVPVAQPDPLPAYDTKVFAIPGAVSGSGISVLARVTVGGNAVPLVQVRATGACVGAGTTDALGHARFTCLPMASVTGIEYEVEVVPSSCGCTADPMRLTLLD